jgi:menaquinone-dependent protoporphyrinogen oxidase
LSGKLTGRVDLVNIKTSPVPNLSMYDRVIIGGSIYVGQIQKQIKEFCSSNLNALKEKKVGLYICCGFVENSSQHFQNAFPKELLDTAVAKECFGGELNIDKMKIFDKLITKMVSKASKKSAADGKSSEPIILVDNVQKLAKDMD